MPETNVHARSARLVPEARVERTGLWAPADEVEERPRGTKCEVATLRVKDRELMTSGVLKGGVDAEVPELVDHVVVDRPVLEPLKVAMKTAAYVLVVLMNDDAAACVCDRQRGGEPGRAGP
jgi:hypothetical protein